MLLALVSWAVQFGVVAAVAGAVLAAARVRSPRVRMATWYAALAVGAASPLATAAWMPSRPSWLVEGLHASAVYAGAAAATPSSIPWTTTALAVLGAGFLARSAWVVAGLVQLRRWAELPEAHSTEFEQAARELGVGARLVCAEVRAPFTFGWRAPIVVANERVLRDGRMARAAFLHELTHVVRSDWPVTLAEEAIRAVLWFHPAAWWATAEIRLAREEVVDRSAAARLGSRRAYLEALVAAATPSCRSVGALGLTHQLARRVHALAVEVPMSQRHIAAAVLAVALALPAAAVGAASAFPVRHAPDATAVAADDDDVQKPEPVKKVQAVYPEEAKKNKIQGEVVLDVTIGADGLVKDARVTKSIPQLDQAALDAIKQWEFRPGRKGGKAVEVRTTITFNFTLK